MVRQRVRETGAAWLDAAAGQMPVRAAVAASWSRVCGYGLPQSRTRAEPLNAVAQQSSRQQHRRLLQAARPVMAQAARWLPHTGCLAALAGADGMVLAVSGDARACAAGERIGLAPGARWREADIGTNAIGTALADGVPVQIHGMEHFCTCLQAWAGAAAPILDPAHGQMLGVLAVVGACDVWHSGWLPYAVALAQQVALHWRHVGESARATRTAADIARPHSNIPDPLRAILGLSPCLRAACEQAQQMALSGAPVLIEGESGVGKELFARAIHGLSAPEGPWVPVNCGGLARELISSELFGYERGAFTGADAQGRAGKFEAAHGGVLCLDEIGEMPMELQAYLLRVLEDGVVYRLGSSRPRQVHTRLVSMTNRDLGQESAAGRFRSDLFYRLAVLRLRVPPLRERVEDIELLAEHYARVAAHRFQRAVPVFSANALDQLRRYAWPGNVRELRNVVESLVCLVPEGKILPEHLPLTLRQATPAGLTVPTQDLRSLERAAILRALHAHRGNVSRAARQLGIARSTLYCRMAHYGLHAGSELPVV